MVAKSKSKSAPAKSSTAKGRQGIRATGGDISSAPESARSVSPPIVESDDVRPRPRIDSRGMAHKVARNAIERYEGVLSLYDELLGGRGVAEEVLCHPGYPKHDHPGYPKYDPRESVNAATIDRWDFLSSVILSSLSDARRDVLRSIVAFDPTVDDVKLHDVDSYYWTPRAYAHDGKLYVVTPSDPTEFEPGKHKAGFYASILTVLDAPNIVRTEGEEGGER